MRVAIIGAGRVGSTLGGRWARRGAEVIFGLREPASEQVEAMLEQAGRHARAATIREAVAAAPIVVLAVPWAAARESIEAAGDLTGKILVDCTNPIRDGLQGLALGTDTSAAEEIARWAPGARVVKAFNTTGSQNMTDPRYGEERASMFICGDDAEAKDRVRQLAEALDFEVVDAGGLLAARYLEPLAMLWIHLAYVEQHGPHIAFRLLQR